MKFNKYALLVVVLLSMSLTSSNAGEIQWGNASSGGGGLEVGTYAELLLVDGPTTGQFVVNDCADSSCVAGGGSIWVTKQWNGAAWLNFTGVGDDIGTSDAGDVPFDDSIADAKAAQDADISTGFVGTFTQAVIDEMWDLFYERTDDVVMVRPWMVAPLTTIDQLDIMQAIRDACEVSSNSLINCKTVVIPRGTHTINDTIFITGNDITSGSGSDAMGPPTATTSEAVRGLRLRGQGSCKDESSSRTAAQSLQCATKLVWVDETDSQQEVMIHIHGARGVTLDNFGVLLDGEQDGVTGTDPASIGVLWTATNSESEVSFSNNMDNFVCNGFSNNITNTRTYTSTCILLAPDDYQDDGVQEDLATPGYPYYPPYATDAQIDDFVVRNARLSSHNGAILAQGNTNGITFYNTRVTYLDRGYWPEDSDLSIFGGYANTWALASCANLYDTGTPQTSGSPDTFCDSDGTTLVTTFDALHEVSCTVDTIAAIMIEDLTESVATYMWNPEVACGYVMLTSTASTRNDFTAMYGGFVLAGGEGSYATPTGSIAESAISYMHQGDLILDTFFGPSNAETFTKDFVWAHPSSGTLHISDKSNLLGWNSPSTQFTINADDAAGGTVAPGQLPHMVINANRMDNDLYFSSSSLIDSDGAINLQGGTLIATNSSLFAPTTPGQLGVDSIVTDWGATLKFYSQSAERSAISVPTSVLTSPTDDYILKYDAVLDRFAMEPDLTGGITPSSFWTAIGQLAYANSSGSAITLNVGTAGQVLTAVDFGGGIILPQWQASSSLFTDHGTFTSLTDDGTLANDATGTTWSITEAGAATFVSVGTDPSDTAEVRLTTATTPVDVAVLVTQSGTDSRMVLVVDDSTQADEPYLELDGIAETVDVLKPMTGTSLSLTGTINGLVPTEFATAATIASGLTLAELSGKWFFVTSGTDTITLPEITTSGASACFYAETAAVITLDTDATDEFVLDGTAGTAGVTIVSPGAAGDFICIMGREVGGNDQWFTLGRSGAWAVGA